MANPKLGLILAGLKGPPPASAAPPQGDMDGDEGAAPGGDEEAIAKDVLAAIEAKDAQGLASALRSFVTVVSGG